MRTLVLALLAASAAASCGGDPDIEGVPEPVADTRPCGGCSGDDVCVDETCEPAFPRWYTLHLIDATLAPRRPDGGCWDQPGCGAPDPTIRVYLDGRHIVGATAGTDRNYSEIRETFDLEIGGPSVLVIAADDEDLFGWDRALTCTFSPLTADRIRGRFVGCEADGSEVRVAISVMRGEPDPFSRPPPVVVE